MLDAFLNLLWSKLCRHNWRKPTPHTEATSLPCVVSGDHAHMITLYYNVYIPLGFLVLRDKMEFGKSGYAANKDDWNRLLMATKVCAIV